MSLLTAANLGFRHGTRSILDGATLSIEPGEKIGLVGRNGSGKTTLMRILLGQLEPDTGQMTTMRGARIGYLSQDPDLDPEETLRGAAEAAFAELHRLHGEINEVYEAMGSADADALEKLLARQVRLEAAIEAAGGYAVDHRIDATLHGLGFTDDQFDIKVAGLSGGQKGRLGLAKLLLEAPDMLLLDEPTNHLDIDGRQWLEDFLSEEYAGAVLVVSHDRWLLDRVVSRIVEVERGRIREYPGGYEKYRALRIERQLTESRVHEKQLDKIRSEEAFIRKFKAGQRAKQARGRETRLDRYKQTELVEKPIELQTMKLTLPKAPRSGDQVVVAEGLAKRYGDLTLFENFDFQMARGERIGILGPNGTGKTTLLKCLLGDLEPDEGTVRLGSRLSVGYYRQLHEGLDLTLTVWQYLQSVIVGLDGAAKASEQQARNLAGAFLFTGAEQDKALGDLSGGERGRAMLAGLVAGAHNLLVLDEPTNHLDIPSAERLEEAMSPDGGYEGSLLLISHDRALIERTCDRLLIFGEGTTPREFLGTYSDWQVKQAEERVAADASRRRATGAEASKPKPTSGGGSGGGGNAKGGGKGKGKRKSKDAGGGALLSKLERLSLPKLEEAIEVAERRIKEIDASLCDPKVYEDAKKCRDLGDERGRLVSDLEPLEFEWARRADDDG